MDGKRIALTDVHSYGCCLRDICFNDGCYHPQETVMADVVRGSISAWLLRSYLGHVVIIDWPHRESRLGPSFSSIDIITSVDVI